MKKLFNIALIIFAVIFLHEIFARQDINSAHLAKLDPSARRNFIQFLEAIKALGYDPVIRDSVRTSEQQDQYHKQDKRNARAGHSDHEFGRAIDLDLYRNKKVFSKKTPSLMWINTGVPELAKEYGIGWGGNFKGYADNNHFYLKT